ncbi:hypothetical protein LJR153_003373 [Paenibacillus sp. LjRoot153]|uniref:hypothetical protein n=1 Tax=Paenibacillus sp. LjRoot153 TaxID=3342270 RepID=UPI003ECC39C0
MEETKRGSIKERNAGLFAGERLLVMLGVFGFVLAAILAVYIGMHGSARGVEGNLESAFSFDIAFGIFIFSIAAFLPLAGFTPRKRKVVRWLFFVESLFAYLVETIQHFRGINPRFTRIGSLYDTIFGALFGLDSLMIIAATVIVAIPFFRNRNAHNRPLLVLSIRYAFLSTMLAFAGGGWMIALQNRYSGGAGNIIVFHGLGFHALQTLPLLGWIYDQLPRSEKYSRKWMHVAGIAWSVSILLIIVQTMLGRSVLEWTLLPILAGIALLGWLGIVVTVVLGMLRSDQGLSLFHFRKEKRLES